MEIIKDIAAILGCILSLISVITICTKKGRSIIASLFKKHTASLQEENKQQTEDIAEIKAQLNNIIGRLEGLEAVSIQQCRDEIKDIYYRYYKEKRIPLYERKTADRRYEIYSQVFHGNTYATLLYSEICKWEIETTTIQDLNED